jgi:inactivated superfamily I helicase
MDPLSIATTSSSLARLCKKTRDSLTSLTIKNVDPAMITALGSEILSLSQILNPIFECFENPSLAAAALNPPIASEHWQNAQGAMKDCEEILKNWDGKLEQVQNSQKGFSAIMKKAINLHSTEVSLFHLQVETYRKVMQLSLQLMMV